jgi:hypothetical protein
MATRSVRIALAACLLGAIGALAFVVVDTDQARVGAAGAAPGTYTEQPGYPALNNTGTTLPVTTVAPGDIMLVMAHTAPSAGLSHVTSITDSGTRIAWQSAKSAGFTNHPSGDALEIWYGVVQSIGSTTIQVHWSGTTFDHFVWAAEWAAPGGTGSWSVVSGGGQNAPVCPGVTCPYPPLKSGPAGGLYWGWAYGSSEGEAGNTPGFTYFVTTDPTHWNVLVSGASLAASTTYTPDFRQATANGWYDAVGVIVEATPTTSGSTGTTTTTTTTPPPTTTTTAPKTTTTTAPPPTTTTTTAPKTTTTTAPPPTTTTTTAPKTTTTTAPKTTTTTAPKTTTTTTPPRTTTTTTLRRHHRR